MPTEFPSDATRFARQDGDFRAVQAAINGGSIVMWTIVLRPRGGHRAPRFEDVMSRGDTWFFVRRFLQEPGRVAALAPSSRWLARAMLRGIEARAGDVVVELGPGTGAFTREIEPWVARGVRYLGIERDPVFHARLCERFPSLRFVLGSAEDTPRLLRDAGLPRARLVVSGLPLAAMGDDLQRRIVAAIRDALAEGGAFRQFSYLHFFPFPSSIRLRHRLRETFGILSLSRPVLGNLPPAFVYHGESR